MLAVVESERGPMASPRPHRSVFRSLVAAVSGETLAKGGAFLATLVVAHTVSGPDFGRFSFAFALVSLGLLLSDFGLAITTTRAIAQDEEHGREYVIASGVIGIAVAVPIYVALMLLAAVGLLPEGASLPVCILGGMLLFAVLINAEWSLFRGWQRLDLLYSSYVLSTVFLLAGIGIAAAVSASLEAICAIYVASYAVRLMLTHYLFRSRLRPGRLLSRPAPFAIRALISTTPLTALAYVFLGLYSNGETVILGFLLSAQRVAEYAAAYKLIDGLMFFIGGALVASVLPVFSRLAKESRLALVKIYDDVLRVAAGVLVVATVFVALLSDPIARLLYGGSISSGAGDFLEVLAPIEVVLALNFISICLLFAISSTRAAVIATGSAAAMNAAISLSLIPVIGAYGAVLATLASAAVMFIAIARGLIGEALHTRFVWTTITAFLVSAAPVGVKATFSISVPIMVVLGVLWALAAVSALGFATREDLGRLYGRLGLSGGA